MRLAKRHHRAAQSTGRARVGRGVKQAEQSLQQKQEKASRRQRAARREGDGRLKEHQQVEQRHPEPCGQSARLQHSNSSGINRFNIRVRIYLQGHIKHHPNLSTLPANSQRVGGEASEG